MRELIGIGLGIVIFRLLLRRTGLAIAAVTLVAMALFLPESGSIPGYLVGAVVAVTIFWIVLFRFGLLAFATAFCTSSLLDNLPLTLHASGWYVDAMLVGLAFIAAPPLWGFWTSRSGRPLFVDGILEPVRRSGA